MNDKNYILSLDQFVEYFLLGSPARSTKAIPNLFAKVPTFKTERGMYDHFTFKFNKSKIFPGHKFVTTAWTSASNDPTGQAIDCGMYPAKFAPEESSTAAGDESRRTDWSRIDLCIECKLDSTSQDPFDEKKLDNSPEAVTRREVLGQILSYAELVFRHQQRQFHYMLLLFRECARIIYFDHSSMVVTEKIPYTTQGQELSEFLARYGRLKKPEFQGHDPTAVRIEKTDDPHDFHSLVRKYAENCLNNNAEDHAARLFRASLVDSWPIWRLQVYDEQTETEHWFAVGKPHFQASGVAGRGTRGYVALPLLLNKNGELSVPPLAKEGEPTKPFVYLKDAWRIDHPRLQKEGVVLQVLNAAKVKYVPTAVYHGDLGQACLSYTKWAALHGGQACKLKPHQHYRLIVKEIGKPLSEFDRGVSLVKAILHCLQAHEQACVAGYIHRDISASNILLCKSDDGKWHGLLNDWELAAKYVMGQPAAVNAELGDCPVLERTGTWQFLSVHCSNDNQRPVDIPDDLESLIHVLLCYAVRFLPHNIQDDVIGLFLYRYFDDYSKSYSVNTCGPAKYAAVQSGGIDLTLLTGGVAVPGKPNMKMKDLLKFYSSAATTTAASENGIAAPTPESHPLNSLIATIFQWFKAYYALDDPIPEVATDFLAIDRAAASAAQQEQPPAAPSSSTAITTGSGGGGSQETSAASDGVVAAGNPAQASGSDPMSKMTHSAFKSEIYRSVRYLKWPRGDKGKDKRPKDFVIPKKAAATPAAAPAPPAGGSGKMNSTKRKQKRGPGSNAKRRKSVK
ncbi:hypothetical protein L227DRAFT_557652 [Lentinus tigrinus ALCF2SS1-6]|uniref:Fungal-type protein kinase domain-containing protein n=1 Tax=Lentinus tigrinus ALCF2SS1-6 TaxID=1328759 RepID=A0A5C2RQ31_9APHY|nr:hypothetical protein L227DRAFT_557652 [Lentinus tigrinus ALCF2SS1-6]